MEDVIRIGFVSSRNPATGTIQVTYQDRDRMVTDDLPVLAFGGEYTLPQVNDMVLVAHLSNDLSSGVVLGKFWNDTELPEGMEWYKRIAEDLSFHKKGSILEIRVPDLKITGAGGELSFSGLLEKLGNLEERLEQLERSDGG